MGRVFRLASMALAAALFSGAIGAQVGPTPQVQPGVAIYALYAQRAAHLQTVGELFTGAQEAAANASGLLVADDLVLTNDHAVPDFGGRYKSVRIDVRLGSRFAQPRTGVVIARDAARDLALVRITPSVTPRPFCPVIALTPDALTPPGSQLYILSYPLDEELGIVDGVVRNHTLATKWQTNASLTVGDSGGPVFASNGYLIGVAVGGITEWTDGDGTTRTIFGLNAIIPMSSLAASPLANAIANEPSGECWRMAVAVGPSPLDPATWSHGIEGSARPTLPERFSHSFSVSQMKDDHPGFSPDKRHYPPRVFNADNGYLIESCKFASNSANNESDVRCDVSADKKHATFSFALQSGPMFDRWRGWIDGNVVFAQVKDR